MRLGVMRYRPIFSSTAEGGSKKKPPAGGGATSLVEFVRLTSSSADIDDADAAAGKRLRIPSGNSHLNHNNNNGSGNMSGTSSDGMESAPPSFGTINSVRGHPTELEFFEDLVSEPVLVLGVDISHMSRQSQFIVCAIGVFGFSLLYGYLQELIAVQICNRNLGLFLAMFQFLGYTILAYVLRNFVYGKQERIKLQRQQEHLRRTASRASSQHNSDISDESEGSTAARQQQQQQLLNQAMASKQIAVPFLLYLGLSLLRALDLGMTNMAMQYINYPAKTLMKSSRIVFTMLFGVVISRKSYRPADYLIVLAMVAGLVIFMHADANSSAVFHHIGVIMLIVSLICDGAISNVSETIMNKFGVGQDEFIFRMYSIALVAITAAAALKGDLQTGFFWLTQPGTYDEFLRGVPAAECTWSAGGKVTVMVLFSSMGFFGSSCSAAITKNFGALAMSITSTARKATTLFLSFIVFHNVCTPEHVAGIVLFISALTAKSLRRRGRDHKKNDRSSKKKHRKQQPSQSQQQQQQQQQSHSQQQQSFRTTSQSLRRTAEEELAHQLQRVSSRDGSVVSGASIRSRASRTPSATIPVSTTSPPRKTSSSNPVTLVHIV